MDCKMKKKKKLQYLLTVGNNNAIVWTKQRLLM